MIELGITGVDLGFEKVLMGLGGGDLYRKREEFGEVRIGEFVFQIVFSLGGDGFDDCARMLEFVN